MKVVLVLILATENAVALKAEEPVLLLSEADRRTIEHDLGQGILGDAVPAPVIVNPAAYLRLKNYTARYRVVEDGVMVRLEPFRLVAESPGWRFQLGEQEEIFLKALTDGSFVLTGSHQLEAGAITHYDPPEPLLFQGLEPGGKRQVGMDIRVYDQDDPNEVIHQGHLDMHLHYLGAYRLAVPAGSYDTVLMKSTFKGKVGPAALEDIQYRFFAPGIGLVATIEHRRLSALIFYRSELNVARLLESF